MINALKTSLKPYKSYIWLFLLTSAANAPGVFPKLVWNEEYVGLTMLEDYIPYQYGDGRPIYALTTQFFFNIIHTSGQMWIYRLFSLVGFLWLTLYLFHKMRTIRNGFDLPLISLILLANSLPAFQTMVHTGNSGIYSWASLLACFAIDLFRQKNTKKKICSITICVIGFLAYPPSVFFIFSYVFAQLLLSKEISPKIYFKNFLQSVILIVTSGIVSYFLAFEIILKLTRYPKSDRTGFLDISDVGEKIIFVLTRFIPTSLRMFLLNSPSKYEAIASSIIVTVILGFLLLVYFDRNIKNTCWVAIFFLVYAFASISFFLITRENEIDFRQVRCSSWLVTFALFFLIINFLANTKLMQHAYFLRLLFTTKIVSMLLVLFSIIIVNVRYEIFFKTPYDTKTSFIISEIRECSRDQVKAGVQIVLPENGFPRYANIGIYSWKTDLSASWVPLPNVILILRELNLSSHFIKITQEKELQPYYCAVSFKKYHI